jgi:hypothetical protein
VLIYLKRRTWGKLFEKSFPQTCAWHGALAELLGKEKKTGSHKTSTVTGRKDNANKARAFPEMGCPEEA